MSGSESLAKSTGKPNRTSHGSTELWDVFLTKVLDQMYYI
jgi:hypothetical protein